MTCLKKENPDPSTPVLLPPPANIAVLPAHELLHHLYHLHCCCRTGNVKLIQDKFEQQIPTLGECSGSEISPPLSLYLHLCLRLKCTHSLKKTANKSQSLGGKQAVTNELFFFFLPNVDSSKTSEGKVVPLSFLVSQQTKRWWRKLKGNSGEVK